AQDAANPGASFSGWHVVEPRSIDEIFHRRQLFEERSLHADTVNEPLHGALILLDIVAKDGHIPAIWYEQRGQDANQGRFTGTIRAENSKDLAAFYSHGAVID